MTRQAIGRVELETPADYRHEITARRDRVRWVRIPARRYLAIEGTDRPGSQGFAEAIGTLYPVAYGLHFALKGRGVTAPVGALEGLYWVGEEVPIAPEAFRAAPGGPAWNWRLLLPVPDEATDEEVAAAIEASAARRRPPRLADLRTIGWEEGPAAQVMHVGPYSEEPATIERLHEAIAAAGLRPRGCHHEVYISDPNRTAPERLKTLIRQPVEPVEPAGGGAGDVA